MNFLITGDTNPFKVVNKAVVGKNDRTKPRAVILYATLAKPALRFEYKTSSDAPYTTVMINLNEPWLEYVVLDGISFKRETRNAIFIDIFSERDGYFEYRVNGGNEVKVANASTYIGSIPLMKSEFAKVFFEYDTNEKQLVSVVRLNEFDVVDETEVDLKPSDSFYVTFYDEYDKLMKIDKFLIHIS
jgi:hypothetical protein